MTTRKKCKDEENEKDFSYYSDLRGFLSSNYLQERGITYQTGENAVIMTKEVYLTLDKYRKQLESLKKILSSIGALHKENINVSSCISDLYKIGLYEIEC